ncbi:MarR family transcriptional regulator [Clostridium estertheticum]|uniref:MarR family transcriptional regulator n=1 Tax=Clostridium estertheticum TaxID=238834 RepID=UPI001C0E6D9E|nr:MarR family transcriptional regulator [Clostridium estertheticum]MBU3174936.1 MarR family transcriptional regulator [Clostridium estertheticum]
MNDFLDSYDDPKNDVDKEILIDKMKEVFVEVQNRHATEDDEEKRWLIENCHNPVISELIPETTAMMLHVLDAIGRYNPVNTITISKKMNIPKGTVSKITRKLIANGLILKESLPNNKKEFHFNITPLGKEFFKLHEALHKRIEIKINKFLKRYDVAELQFLISILEDFSKISWINAE